MVLEIFNVVCLLQETPEAEKDKKDEEKEKEKEKKKEQEPNFQMLENPARAMPAQLRVLTMPESCRYQPFKPVRETRTHAHPFSPKHNQPFR